MSDNNQEKPKPIFADGMIVKERHPNTPEWVICNVSIKKQEFINFLNTVEGDWVNLAFKRGKLSGKNYAELNTWKKEEAQQVNNNDNEVTPTEEFKDNLPF